jgi:negative regulator of sigma-B (phosphoserine phosphatase)
VEHGAVVRPKHGERVSGDAAFAVNIEGGVVGVIVDVLGHGHDAHELATRIEAHMHTSAGPDVVGTLTSLHERFRGSRGAAMGVCMIESATGLVHYCGIGNTVARCFGEAEARLVSRDGVVGGITMRTPIEQTWAAGDGGVVVLYTDGVASHFESGEYPGLRSDDPAAAAETIVRRFGKAHDDASCLVLRYRR